MVLVDGLNPGIYQLFYGISSDHVAFVKYWDREDLSKIGEVSRKVVKGDFQIITMTYLPVMKVAIGYKQR